MNVLLANIRLLISPKPKLLKVSSHENLKQIKRKQKWKRNE